MDDNFGDPYAVFDGVSFSPELNAQPDITDSTPPTQDARVSEPIPAATPSNIQQAPISAPESSSCLDSFLEWPAAKEQAEFGSYPPIDPPLGPTVSEADIDLVFAEVAANRASGIVEPLILDGPVVLDGLAADVLPEPQPPSVAQLLQPPIVPSQPFAPFQPVAPFQEFTSVAPPTPAQQSAPPVLSLPPAQPQVFKTVTAVQMIQANDRWNAKYSESGLRSWGALKPDMKKEMTRETQMGEVRTQISWDDAFRQLGQRQFFEYYHEQCQMAKQHNLPLEELPDWIKLFTGYHGQSLSAPPRPDAVTHRAVAQKLLNRGNRLDKGKGKARMDPAPRPKPYARH